MKDNIKLAIQAVLIILGPLLIKHHLSFGNDEIDDIAGAISTIWGVIWKFWHWNTTPDASAPTAIRPPTSGIIALALLLASVLCLPPTAFCQDVPSASPELKTSAVTFLQNVSSNRSLTIAAYPMYAPDIVVNGKKDTFGIGIAFLAPADAIPALQGTVIGNHAFAGLRFDYLAHQAFASTVGVGLKGNLQLWGHNFEGFIHAGANIPISGFGNNNANLGGMAGGGVYTDLYHFSPNAVLGLQASTERWTQFNSQVYLGGPVFNWSF